MAERDTEYCIRIKIYGSSGKSVGDFAGAFAAGKSCLILPCHCPQKLYRHAQLLLIQFFIRIYLWPLFFSTFPFKNLPDEGGYEPDYLIIALTTLMSSLNFSSPASLSRLFNIPFISSYTV
jgi:hypothetical protein